MIKRFMAAQLPNYHTVTATDALDPEPMGYKIRRPRVLELGADCGLTSQATLQDKLQIVKANPLTVSGSWRDFLKMDMLVAGLPTVDWSALGSLDTHGGDYALSLVSR